MQQNTQNLWNEYYSLEYRIISWQAHTFTNLVISVPEAVAGSSAEDPSPPEGDASTSVRSELIGVVHTMYKFNSKWLLCPFL